MPMHELIFTCQTLNRFSHLALVLVERRRILFDLAKNILSDRILGETVLFPDKGRAPSVSQEPSVQVVTGTNSLFVEAFLFVNSLDRFIIEIVYRQNALGDLAQLHPRCVKIEARLFLGPRRALGLVYLLPFRACLSISAFEGRERGVWNASIQQGWS